MLQARRHTRPVHVPAAMSGLDTNESHIICDEIRPNIEYLPPCLQDAGLELPRGPLVILRNSLCGWEGQIATIGGHTYLQLSRYFGRYGEAVVLSCTDNSAMGRHHWSACSGASGGIRRAASWLPFCLLRAYVMLCS